MNPSGLSLNENVPVAEDVIKAINKDAVHRICSGQVVLNLATAVKELVENALDAGATIIDIRLKEYGQELIEVHDNGCGVAEPNFSGLALKYHTSKLREFSDLLGISTFGFRGEALSSLCAMSELNVTTRHMSADCGTKIIYNSKGVIEKITPCARQIGTTVSLSKLFYTLPVRQKEFHRNIKREFNKMTQILYAYCLVSEGVKITCSNQTIKGNKSVVVSTQGGKINDNIACVFGSKQLQSLLKLTPVIPDITVKNVKEKFFSDLENAKTQPVTSDETIDIDDIKPDDLELSEESSNDDNTSTGFDNTNVSVISPNSDKGKTIRKMKTVPVDFDGFISSCEHSSGRSTTDRQFFYINSRPCEPQKITKLINETYKQFNSNQYPFVYLNLKVKQSSVDVNVTPDKRKIFLERENFILDTIKASLLNVFENIPSTLRFGNVKNSTQKSENIDNNATNHPRIFSSFLSQFTNKGCKKENNENVGVSSEVKRKAETLDDYIECKIIRTKSPETVIESVLPEDSESENEVNSENEPNCVQEVENIIETPKIEHVQLTDSGVEIFDEPKEAVFLGYTDRVPLSQVVSVNEILVDSKETKTLNDSVKKKSPKSSEKKVTKTVKNDFSSDTLSNRNSCTVDISVEQIKQYLQDDMNRQSNAKSVEKVKFRTEIDPVLNKKCEEELQKELSKDMFSKMKIIGQFNLGFIITKLQDDLFIIDQHASDEKYNFETLQKTTVLSNQKLVVHKNLELTGSNERLLMDNLEIFHKNGFTFEIDPEAPPTKRVKLLTVPISKNCIFGKNDIEEILFMLKDGSSNDIYRPSRIQSMFASRACRKSVMIGTALNNSVMRKLVDHMGIIDHPWNCPHGRPTIRHLINLALSESRS